MKTLGIIAGNRTFPLIVAKEARTSGVNKIVAVAFKDITDPQIDEFVDSVCWIGLGQLGKLIQFFKKEDVDQLIMAGQIPHHLMFNSLKLDMRGIKFLANRKIWAAQSILGYLVEELEREGFEWLSSTCFLSSEIAAEGVLTKKKPSEDQLQDIQIGLKVIKQIADFDIGQTLVIKKGVVVAVEAMEGTDETILRGGKLARKGAVVIKVARSSQDLRYDVPIVGEETLIKLKEIKASVLAVEAAVTLFLDKKKVIEQANHQGLAIIGVK